jgi:leucyl aminopeptidase
MRISFAKPALDVKGALCVFVGEGGALSPTAERLDKDTGGAISRAMGSARFKGGAAATLTVLAPASLKASRIVLIGTGNAKELDAVAAQGLGGAIVAALNGGADADGFVAVDAVKDAPLKAADIAANLALGATLRSYRFDKYRTKEKAEDKPALKILTVMTRDDAAAKAAHRPMARVAEGVFLTRDLVSEPANVIFPISLAQRCRALEKLGVKVQVLDEKQMAKLGMGSLLGVAQGSANKPRLVAMRWNGVPAGAKDKRPIAFVGKGVTFDTGGISIKPAGGMEDMKWDMGGSGVVIGLMHALAARKAKVNAVGVVGLVENMPGSNAQRPGDVVKTMSGQTIEVINTDAEGRLVLADAMWWTQDKFKPKAMIDLATLTGAIIIALGHHHAGMFANDDTLADDLLAAGKAVGEPVWRMPLGEDYDKQVRSDIADMKNVGGRDAGSITAAQILQRFVKSGVAWAHLDIAGVTWTTHDLPVAPKGGTAFGVRLLDRLVADKYEAK